MDDKDRAQESAGYSIRLEISFRDGWIRIVSPNVPGLLLASPDHSAAYRDLGPAIEYLLNCRQYEAPPTISVAIGTSPRVLTSGSCEKLPVVED